MKAIPFVFKTINYRQNYRPTEIYLLTNNILLAISYMLIT